MSVRAVSFDLRTFGRGGDNNITIWRTSCVAVLFLRVETEPVMSDMSYFWGVLGLLQKMNNGALGGSWKQLIQGATDYNGGGNTNCQQLVKDALKMIGSGPQ